MPIIKKYRNQNGYYIRSNINDRYVTLQLSPEAEGLLTDLGFDGGDQISWQFLKPLCDSGHTYTNDSGTTVGVEETESEIYFSPGKLSLEKKRRLEMFLNHHTSNKLANKENHLSTTDEGSSSLDQIDQTKQGSIKEWSLSDEEYEATLNRIAGADDVDAILNSIAHHHREHPILINRFRVSPQGTPTYSFDTDGISWTVHDLRTIDTVGADADLFIDIQPGTSYSQSVTIEPEATEWHTTGERFTGKQIDEFLTVAPDLLYYYYNLVSSPSPDPCDVVSNPTAEINTEDASRLESLENLEIADPTNYSRALGTILSLGSRGYGRIRGHTGHTFTFSQGEVESGSIVVGDVVTFELKSHRDSVYAKSIRVEETGIPGSEIVRNWPEWQDLSISWLRDNWTERREKQISSNMSISISSPDEEDNSRYIEVQIDSIAFYLANSVNETSDIFDEAIRTLLKQIIDGKETIPKAPSATNVVEISLPSDLLSIIDSVVDTSSVYETRDQFFIAALQNFFHENKEDQVELAVHIPHIYHDATQRLAEEHEVSTPKFIQETLEQALAATIHRNNRPRTNEE